MGPYQINNCTIEVTIEIRQEKGWSEKAIIAKAQTQEICINNILNLEMEMREAVNRTADRCSIQLSKSVAIKQLDISRQLLQSPPEGGP